MAIAQAAQHGNVTTASPKSAALARLRAAIGHYLSDPLATPDLIAASAGISARYANRLLSDEGTSLAREVQRLRIEQCRQALASPAQRHRSITEIAFAWGFNDLSHFSRRFREAVGCSPRDYRALSVSKPSLGASGFL